MCRLEDGVQVCERERGQGFCLGGQRRTQAELKAASSLPQSLGKRDAQTQGTLADTALLCPPAAEWSCSSTGGWGAACRLFFFQPQIFSEAESSPTPTETRLLAVWQVWGLFLSQEGDEEVGNGCENLSEKNLEFHQEDGQVNPSGLTSSFLLLLQVFETF